MMVAENANARRGERYLVRRSHSSQNPNIFLSASIRASARAIARNIASTPGEARVRVARFFLRVSWSFPGDRLVVVDCVCARDPRRVRDETILSAERDARGTRGALDSRAFVFCDARAVTLDEFASAEDAW